MKEKCPVEKLLRVNREKRIEKKDERPEPRRASNQRKEEFRSQEVNGDSEADDADSIANKDGGEVWPDVVPVSELREVERGITPKDEKGQERDDQEIRNRQVWDATEIDEQRDNHKNGGELDNEKK
jgi:hypothetical protein